MLPTGTRIQFFRFTFPIGAQRSHAGMFRMIGLEPRGNGIVRYAT
jgi:hypothetical protein